MNEEVFSIELQMIAEPKDNLYNLWNPLLDMVGRCTIGVRSWSPRRRVGKRWTVL